MPETTATSTWVIVPAGFFSRHYKLLREGQFMATLEMALMHEACGFTIGGHEFTIQRASLWRDGFLLTSGGETLCQVRRSFWSRRFEILAVDQTWSLMRAGLFSRSYVMLAGVQKVGSIQPTGWFTRQRIAHFSEDVPLPIQVLAIFVVLIVARRQQSAAGT